jgi:hypothetical protein
MSMVFDQGHPGLDFTRSANDRNCAGKCPKTIRNGFRKSEQNLRIPKAFACLQPFNHHGITYKFAIRSKTLQGHPSQRVKPVKELHGNQNGIQDCVVVADVSHFVKEDQPPFLVAQQLECIFREEQMMAPKAENGWTAKVWH